MPAIMCHGGGEGIPAMRIPSDYLLHRFGCAVLLLDRTGRVTFANEAARRMLHLQDPTPLRADSLTWSSPGRRGEDPFGRLLRGETLSAEEFTLEFSDGTRTTVLLNGTPLTNSRGSMEGAVVDFQDVTKKNEAARRLLEAKEKAEASEIRLKALVGSIDEIVFEFDGEGTYLNVWTANETLLRKPREELVGHKVTEVLGDAVGGSFLETLRRVRDTGRPETLEYPMDVLGGKRWFLARIAPIPPTGEGPLTLSFLARDITERKRVEKELRASERRFHQILENVHLAALILDTRGGVLYCNDFLARLTGCDRDEIQGKNWFELFSPPEERKEAKARWREAVCNTSAGFHPQQIVTCSGNKRLIGWNTIVVRNLEGEAVSCASIGEDITERRRAEEVLRRSDRMKSEFISTAAHELRTPLTSILGYAELLLREKEFGGFAPAEQREFLSEIRSKAEHLNDIVSRLLDLSRFEEDVPIQLEFSPCRLEEVLEEAVARYREHFPEHRFELTFAEACPRDVQIDRRRLVDVVENLLSNAAKYSRPGGCIRVRGSRKNGGYLVEVADEGIGMTPEEVERVFDKFFRADASHTAVSGLGLGMSLARNIVEAHGGRIRVQSEPGRGTWVSFSLPARKQPL